MRRFGIKPPRISLKAFLSVVTLACLYLAGWNPTATTGVRDTEAHILLQTEQTARVEPRMPFVLGVTVVALDSSITPAVIETHTYYIWVFGWVVKAPFSTKQTLVARSKGEAPASPRTEGTFER